MLRISAIELLIATTPTPHPQDAGSDDTGRVTQEGRGSEEHVLNMHQEALVPAHNGSFPV